MRLGVELKVDTKSEELDTQKIHSFVGRKKELVGDTGFLSFALPV